MLKHHYTILIFFSVLAALILLDALYGIHWTIYALLCLLFLSVEFYGATFISSGFHLKAICSIPTTNKVIALTFDDGPATETAVILDLLNEFNVKATFFCIGHHIKGKEALLKRIDKEGHVIGNHSYSHSYFFDLKNTSTLIHDLNLANEQIKQVIGKTPRFFRPPYGVTTPGLARAIKKLNFEVVGWNIRSFDTRTKDQEQLFSRIKEQLKPGSILLMHDTVAGIDIALRNLLLYLKEQNYEIVSLDHFLQKKAYA